MITKTTIRDTILSFDAIGALMQLGWKPEKQYNKHTLILYFSFPYLQRTEQILDFPVRECGEIMVKMSLNALFQIDQVDIIDGEGFRISAGNLEDEIYKRISGFLDKQLVYSFKNDIKIGKISDYPKVNEYYTESLKPLYASNTADRDIPVLGIPANIWSQVWVSPTCPASYISELGSICYLDKSYKSQNFFDSLLIHQVQHALQDVSGFLMSPTEAGLDISDLDALGQIFVRCKSYRDLSEKLNISYNNLIRCSLLHDMRGTESFTDRFSSLLERNAIAEQMIYLIDHLNLDEEKTAKAIRDYFFNITDFQWVDYKSIISNRTNLRYDYLSARVENILEEEEIRNEELEKSVSNDDVDLSSAEMANETEEYNENFTGLNPEEDL